MENFFNDQYDSEMYLHEKDIVSTKKDPTFNILWMKHKNGLWYASMGNKKRWHCLYSEEENTARENFFNSQYGPELFLICKDISDQVSKSLV